MASFDTNGRSGTTPEQIAFLADIAKQLKDEVAKECLLYLNDEHAAMHKKVIQGKVLVQKVKKLWICLKGKILTPWQRNPYLFHSSQFPLS